MRTFVVLFEEKPRQFGYLSAGMQFAAVAAELSIEFGFDRELNAAKNRMPPFRARKGYPSSTPWTRFSRDDGGIV